MRHRLTVTLLLAGAAAVLPLAGSLAPASAEAEASTPAAVVTFYQEATVEGSQITLGDIALIETDEDVLAEQLGQIAVGRAPAPGFTRSVSARYSRIRVRIGGLPMDRLDFGGASLIRVTRASQTIKGAEIFKVAAAAVQALVEGGIAHQVSVPRDIIAPLGEVELVPQNVRAPAINRTTTVAIAVIVEGEPVTRVTVSLRIVVPAPVLVATRDLPRGTILTADDVRVEMRARTTAGLALTQSSQVVNQQTTRNLRAGSPLTRRSVRPAVLVKRNEHCHLICVGPGFSIKATGKALQDGVLGQKVRVRNLASKLDVVGIVIAPGKVRVDF